MSIFSRLFKSRDKPQNSYDSPSYTYFFGRANSGKRVTDRTALQHICGLCLCACAVRSDCTAATAFVQI